MHPSSGTPNPREAYGMQGRVRRSVERAGAVHCLAMQPQARFAERTLHPIGLTGGCIASQCRRGAEAPLSPGPRAFRWTDARIAKQCNPKPVPCIP
jgi:hypothetical protein